MRVFWRNHEAKCLFLNLDIGKGVAGVEASALARARMFDEYLHVTPTMVTTLFNTSLHENRLAQAENKRTAKSLRVINLYDYFQDAMDVESRPKMPADFDAFRKIEVPGSPDWRFYDHRGDFVAYCKCDQTSGRVSFVNYLRGGGVYRRETYDCRGFLSKVDLIFKKEVGEEVHELYLRPNGSIGILKEAHVENGVATVKSIQITDAQGRVVRDFESEKQWLEYWLDLLVKKDRRGTGF